MPLELAVFERGVTGIEEPVYRYGKLSHTRRRVSDSALMKLLAAEQPDKYGRAAGFGAMLDGLERKIETQVAAEVAALGEELRGEGETLRGEVVSFVTTLFDALLPVLASLAEGECDTADAGRRPRAPETSPNPVQP